MRSLKFKYISAQNFLCFGPDGIEINFDEFSKIVFIQGINKDAKLNEDDCSLSEKNKISSNGSGKSSIQEIIVYGLFGKTVKKHTALKKDGVIHNLVGKNCKVEIIWDNFRVVRTRGKNTLRLWESSDAKWEESTEITTGSMDETQLLIEEKLGLNYETFLSICVFSDDQSNSFLESETSVKRQIIENLLSLGVYRKWQEKASEGLKNKKSNLSVLAKEYDLMDSHFSGLKNKQNQLQTKNKNWQEQINNEIVRYKQDLNKLQNELQTSNYTEQIKIYNEAQLRIKELSEILETKKSNHKKYESKKQLIDSKKTEISSAIDELKSKIADLKYECKNLKDKIHDIQSHIDSLKSKKDHKVCNYCHGEIDPKNIDSVINQELESIEKLKVLIKEKLLVLNPLDSQFKEKVDSYNKILTLENECVSKMTDLHFEIESDTKEIFEKNKIKEPKPESKTLEIQTKINQLEENIKTKMFDLKNNNPFVDMIESGEKEIDEASKKLEEKKKEVVVVENEIPYYQFWSHGFGDKGIRKIIVDGMIPQLNNRILFWLQYLNDNVINLKFDSEFNEIIERNPPDGVPYIYHAMSAGQRRRLNLAVSQAFADVMSITAGCTPSIMFLDEVTTNIDPLGVQGIHNIVHALSEDKQIFITTHDHDFIKMLESCDVMQLVHEKGFTTLKKD